MAGISVRERVNSISGVEINTVIINEEKDTSMYDLDSTIGGVKYFFKTLFSQGPYIFVQADQKLAWLLSLDNSREKYLSSTDYTEVDVLSQAKKIPCTPRSENGWNIIPSDIVDQVVSESDVFIRFAFGLLTGEILSRPQYGVLSAHTADIREIRGLGPQIQFLRNKREAAVTLQQLNNDVDGGK